MTLTESIAEAIHRDPIPIFGIVFGCTAGSIIAVSVMISKAWRSVRQTEYETELKMQLLDQGKSADEIERIVRASSTREKC